MSERSKQADKKRSKFWKYHLKEWSRSGQSQKAYCRDHSLRTNRFTYWKNKFKKQNMPVEFVQVAPAQITEAVNCHGGILRLNIESGFQIEIPDGFSQITLAQVLQVLGRG